MSGFAVVTDAAGPVSGDDRRFPITPAGIALLPSADTFATLLDEFLASLSPHKRPKTLIDSATYTEIRAILREPDLKSDSAFCSWARRVFRLDDNGKYILHDGKRVARSEDLYQILCAAHVACGHGGRDHTFKEVRKMWRFVPKDMVARFVKACPICGRMAAGASAAKIDDGQQVPTPVPPPALPRLLISPASDVIGQSPPSTPASSVDIPLGSPTTEILTGFAPSVSQAMGLAPVLDISNRSRAVTRMHSAVIPPDTAPAPYPAPPLLERSYSAASQSDVAPSVASLRSSEGSMRPLSVKAKSTKVPPPRPPRSPLRPLPVSIARESRDQIDMYAASVFKSASQNASVKEAEDINAAALSTAFSSNIPSDSPTIQSGGFGYAITSRSTLGAPRSNVGSENRRGAFTFTYSYSTDTLNMGCDKNSSPQGSPSELLPLSQSKTGSSTKGTPKTFPKSVLSGTEKS